MSSIDIGDPASVAAGNRQAAQAPPDLTPVIEHLSAVAGAYPPEQQAVIGQCLQQLAQIQGGGGGAGAQPGGQPMNPVANGAAGLGG